MWAWLLVAAGFSVAAALSSSDPAIAQTGGAWNQVGQDIDGENMFDVSGEGLAMSADGNTVIIGAGANDGGGIGFGTGHARIFSFNGTTWQQVGQDIDGENDFDFAGESVAMSADGNTVVIGATNNADNGSAAGHARIFSFDGNKSAKTSTAKQPATTLVGWLRCRQTGTR